MDKKIILSHQSAAYGSPVFLPGRITGRYIRIPFGELYNRGRAAGRRCPDGSYIGTRTTGRNRIGDTVPGKAQKIPQGKVGHRQSERHRQIRRQRQ